MTRKWEKKRSSSKNYRNGSSKQGKQWNARAKVREEQRGNSYKPSQPCKETENASQGEKEV
jgi:hypothetical protein